VLQVKQVPHELGHLRLISAEVQAGEVAHGLQALSPLGLILIPNREERDRRICCAGEAVLTKCGEGDVCHLLDHIVNLIPNDGSLPWHRGIDRYLHLDLTDIQAVCLKRDGSGRWELACRSRVEREHSRALMETPGGVGP
jgi:hypothetical protein